MSTETRTETPIISIPGARLPEGITYNPDNNSLLWVDIVKGELHRVELPKTKKEEYSESDINTIKNSHEVVSYREENPNFQPTIGAVALTRDHDVVVVAAKQGLAFVNFKGLSFEYKYKFDFLPESIENLRSNDSMISPAGNFWVGIMATNPLLEDKKGWLAKFDHKTLQYTVLLENLTIPNGMAWNKSLTKFYHIDSLTHIIKVYDYNKESDTISNGQDFFDTSKLNPFHTEPDGLTIDKDDNLYVALWEGSAVYKISPEAEVLHKFSFPARRTNCPIIGGSQMDELFVSTADVHLDEPDKLGSEEGDLGGSIFRVKLSGIKGRNKYIWEGPTQ